MEEREEEATVDDLLDEMEDIAQALRDTFRHNQVIPVLQQWREERVTRLEACIAALKSQIAKPLL